MVEALIFYLISIMISLLIDYKNYYQVLYEINKRGNYVVNNLYDVAFKTSYGTSVIERLIPIYNIIKPLFIGLNINVTFDKFYDILDKANLL